MTEKRKSQVDWEAVEKLYRAGILSLREIAKAHSISDTAIRKRAKQDGWERDLTARVQEKVRTELVRKQVRAEVSANLDERQIIEEAAATVVQVVRSHRGKINQGQSLVELLTNQLIEAANSREDLEAEVEEMTADDTNMKRRARLMKAIDLPTHAATAKNLADAAKTWIGLERQAFSIKDDSAPYDKPLSITISQDDSRL